MEEAAHTNSVLHEHDWTHTSSKSNSPEDSVKITDIVLSAALAVAGGCVHAMAFAAT